MTGPSLEVVANNTVSGNAIQFPTVVVQNQPGDAIHLILLTIWNDPPHSGPTDTQGNSYTQLDQVTVTGNVILTHWLAANTLGVTTGAPNNTISMELTYATNQVTFIARCFSGVLSTPLDGNIAGSAATGTAISTGSGVASTNANEPANISAFIWGIGSTGLAPGSGFTTSAGPTGASFTGGQFLTEDKALASVGSAQAATGSITFSGPWAAVMAIFDSGSLQGQAVSSSTATGTLVAYASVILTAPLFAGVGSVADPNFWLDSTPGVGTTVYYDPSNITILADGEINSISNNCQAAIYFIDGLGSRADGLVVFTPNFVGYIGSPGTAGSVATGALTTPAMLSGDAVSSVSASGALSGAAQLAGSASDSSVATGTLQGSVITLSGNAFSATGASGALTAPTAPLIEVFDPMTSVISQFANSPTLLRLISNQADALLN